MLVSTTVIEVGVDVPNATVMVIENAERFGLSALHQLRGRVGARRGGFLLHPDLRQRAMPYSSGCKFLCHTSDGFAVAKYDLETRGPGDFFGSRQHGLPTLRVAGPRAGHPHADRSPGGSQSPAGRGPKSGQPEHRALSDEVERLFATAGAMN